MQVVYGLPRGVRQVGEWCGSVDAVVGYWCTRVDPGHDGGVSLDHAPVMTVPPRGPGDWVEDMYWHRRGFNQSKFRWRPEQARHIALVWARGRCSFETPGHLRRLDAQLLQLREYTGQIQDAMAPELREARSKLGRPQWTEGLKLLDLTPADADFIIITAHRLDPHNQHPQVRRALRGIPLPNPFSRVWELRQVHALHRAAVDLLEDEVCDLASSLAPRHGWDNLAALTTDRIGWQLERRVNEHLETRGLPEDPRRHPGQRFPLPLAV